MVQAVKLIYHKLIRGMRYFKEIKYHFNHVILSLFNAEAKMTRLSYDPSPANIAASHLYI